MKKAKFLHRPLFIGFEQSLLVKIYRSLPAPTGIMYHSAGPSSFTKILLLYGDDRRPRDTAALNAGLNIADCTAYC